MPARRLDQESRSAFEVGLSIALQYGGSKEKSLSVFGNMASELNDVIDNEIKINPIICFLVMVCFLNGLFDSFQVLAAIF